MTTRLDTALIHDRCAELGLGPEEFTAATGITHRFLTENASAVTMQLLGQIADVLRLHPTALITTQPQGPDCSADADSTNDDALLVEAMVTHAGSIDVRDLAARLGWPRQRLTDALHALDTQLRRHKWCVNLGDSNQVEIGRVTDRAVPADMAHRLDDWFAAHTRLEPRAAAAAVRLLRSSILAPPADRRFSRTNKPTATRLVEHRIAVIIPDGGGDERPWMAATLDTTIAVHPDLLFALSLGPAPTGGCQLEAQPESD